MAMAELICWLDEESRKAEVRISDGDISLTAFCDGFSGNRECGEIALTSLAAKDAVIADGFMPPEQVGFAGELTAVIAERKENILRLGNIIIELDGYIPGDAADGQWMRSRFERLDYLE